MRKLRLKVVADALVAVFMLVGCAGLVGNVSSDSATTTAWKTLMTNKQLYDAAFKAMNLLDMQGKLPAQAKADAIKAGNYYVAAHNVAVQALLDGKSVDLKLISAALDAFLAIVAPYYLGVE